jgi:hypothetical protein
MSVYQVILLLLLLLLLLWPWTWPFFSFLILYTVGRTPWTGEQPVGGPVSIRRTTQTQNKSTQASMPRVGFEPTIPVFELARPM